MNGTLELLAVKTKSWDFGKSLDQTEIDKLFQKENIVSFAESRCLECPWKSRTACQGCIG